MMNCRTFSILSTLVIFTLIMISTPTWARSVSLVDSTDDQWRVSLEYEYGQSDFEKVDTSGGTQLTTSTLGARLEKSLTDDLQIYASGGRVKQEFGDTDVEDGVRWGGGIQYVFEQNDDLRYKLIGSYFTHSDENFKDNNNRTFEVVNDWQAGLMISRVMKSVQRYKSVNQSHAYMSVAYTGQELEITESGTTNELEFENYEGASITGGVRIKLEEQTTLEIEGEAGSTVGGSARLNVEL